MAAALEFPTPSAIGDLYIANGKTYEWNGVSWLSFGNLIPSRYLEILAVEKSTALSNNTDIIGEIEIPMAGTIKTIRAKTSSGTATVTFNINGSSIGSVNATTSGVSTTVSSAISALAKLTLDISSANGSGLVATVTIQE